MADEKFEQQLESIRTGRGVEGSPMEVIPSLLRGAFRAPAGYQFVAADYSQIELRVLAWLTHCRPMLKTFADDLDLYIAFAASMYNTIYQEVTKAQRQIAKPAVLSCGYGSGGGELRHDESGDELKTGLWGYAAGMGIDMTQKQAWDAVVKYRMTYAEVPQFWNDSMEQIKGLLDAGKRNPRITHRVIFDRLILTLWPNKMLRVMLPSGRSLTYLKPALNSTTGEVIYETELINKQRGLRRLYGSLFTENLVQAIARDVMAVGMVRAYDAGFKIVGHTHDELLTICPLTGHHNLTYLNNMMVDAIGWCSDLPLKSEGWEGPVYKK